MHRLRTVQFLPTTVQQAQAVCIAGQVPTNAVACLCVEEPILFGATLRIRIHALSNGTSAGG